MSGAPQGNKSQYKSLTKALEENIALFQGIFPNDEALIIRRFQNKRLDALKCCVLYFDGMVKSENIDKSIIRPILSTDASESLSTDNLMDELLNKVIISDEVKYEADIRKLLDAVMYGDCIFLLEGYDRALLINTRGWQTRAVTEPESAKVVRGPREGFTESIIMNTSLLRRKIRNPQLRFKFKEIGTQTHTITCICYIEGIASEAILKELEERLGRIEIDGILDSGYIQEFIRDAPFSPFETVGYTERPDVVAGKLLEGRIAVIVDGSPFVLTVPFVFAEAAQSSEDYYNNFYFASINRFLRTTALLSSVCLPAIFQALVTYHQETLPTPLLLSISASRHGVPFPTVLSMFMMLLIFDILREAGTRMPTPIGQAINIVGTLVLGQAAVEAKLVGAPVLIVTALTGILTLMNASMIGAAIIIRFSFLVFASVLGLYGFVIGFLLVVLHLMSLRSFGVPYTLGLSKVKNHDSQDTWIRAPWWSMTLRPKIIGARNLVRQTPGKNRRR